MQTPLSNNFSEVSDARPDATGKVLDFMWEFPFLVLRQICIIYMLRLSQCVYVIIVQENWERLISKLVVLHQAMLKGLFQECTVLVAKYRTKINYELLLLYNAILSYYMTLYHHNIVFYDNIMHYCMEYYSNLQYNIAYYHIRLILITFYNTIW